MRRLPNKDTRMRDSKWPQFLLGAVHKLCNRDGGVGQNLIYDYREGGDGQSITGLWAGGGDIYNELLKYYLLLYIWEFFFFSSLFYDILFPPIESEIMD